MSRRYTLPLRAVTFDLWFTLIWADLDLDRYYRRCRIEGLTGFARQLRPETTPEEIEAGNRQVQAEFEQAGRLPAELHPSERVQRLFQVLGISKPSATVVEAASHALSLAGFDRPPYLNDEAPAVLLELKHRLGLRLGLVSNVGRSGAVYRDLLDRLGLLPYLDVVVLSCELGSAKPKPAIFRAALNLLHTEPVESLHVGDHYETDIQGAIGVGMHAVLYTGLWKHYQPGLEGASPSRLPDGRNIPTISSLTELPVFLREFG